MYLAEKRRSSLRETALSFDDYLRGLDQTLIVRHADADAIGRVAQMPRTRDQVGSRGRLEGHGWAR